MKKWIALLLTSLLLLLPLLAGAEKGSAPLIYRVTDDQGHTVYLLGTIHIGKEDMYPLSDAVERAYQEAEILAVEADILAYSQSLIQMAQMSVALMYGLGDDATQHMSPENYARAVELMEYPELLLRRMRLVGWISLAEEKIYQLVGLSSEWGVDMHLLRRAHADGKQIDELEGMEEQMDVLFSMPDSIAEMQIMSSLENMVPLASSYNLLAGAWQTGNQTLFRLMLQSEDTPLDQLPERVRADYEQYMDVMYHNRDSGFEEQVIDYLAQGKTVLFAVGAAHILAQDGVVDRLIQAGYTVEEIGR